MAVYKRGYQRYRGATTGRLARLMVLPRFAWQRLLEQRLIVIVMVVGMFWPLACGVFIYLANHTELWQNLNPEFKNFLKIDGQFFVLFMNVQSGLAIILAAFAGPSLIAPDLANGALPLYFSRPLSRADYVLARLMVLVGLLSPITWVPGLLLFAVQSSGAGWEWVWSNWTIALGIVAGFSLWILLVSLIALACSAYVKWRIVAGALVLAFFFVAAGASELINGVLRMEWGSILNPARDAYQIWCWMLGTEGASGPGALESGITLAVMCAVLILVLERKLRPVEVVS